jgi:hypothetical protein
MADNDALERLKQRNRPNVENRDASLTPTSTPVSQDTPTSGNQDTEIPVNLEAQTNSNLHSPMSENLDNSTRNVNPSPKARTTTKQVQEIETKQSTLRLEAQVSERLQVLCREQGVCREVLIEAMFEYLEVNPKALSKVLNQAKEKNDYRQQLANYRRAKSMMEKFS